jgi:hypothetical protein
MQVKELPELLKQNAIFSDTGDFRLLSCLKMPDKDGLDYYSLTFKSKDGEIQTYKHLGESNLALLDYPIDEFDAGLYDGIVDGGFRDSGGKAGRSDDIGSRVAVEAGGGGAVNKYYNDGVIDAQSANPMRSKGDFLTPISDADHDMYTRGYRSAENPAGGRRRRKRHVTNKRKKSHRKRYSKKKKCHTRKRR